MARRPPTTAVATVPWPRNERGALAGLKTTSYAENVVALARRASGGATEAVFANLAGHLCEGTGTNVFYVVDGELRTPTLASGCLAGVTRGLVLEWSAGARSTSRSRCWREASEVFLASTTRDVQGVERWDDRELDGGPVPVTAERAAPTWRRARAATAPTPWGSEHPRMDGTPQDRALKFRLAREGPEGVGAIGAVVARFVHTEEVTGSNPVSPRKGQVRGPGLYVDQGTGGGEEWLWLRNGPSPDAAPNQVGFLPKILRFSSGSAKDLDSTLVSGAVGARDTGGSFMPRDAGQGAWSTYCLTAE